MVDVQFYVYVIGFGVVKWFEQVFGGCFVDVWVLVDYMDVDEVCIDVGDDVDYVVC